MAAKQKYRIIAEPVIEQYYDEHPVAPEIKKWKDVEFPITGKTNEFEALLDIDNIGQVPETTTTGTIFLKEFADGATPDPRVTAFELKFKANMPSTTYDPQFNQIIRFVDTPDETKPEEYNELFISIRHDLDTSTTPTTIVRYLVIDGSRLGEDYPVQKDFPLQNISDDRFHKLRYVQNNDTHMVTVYIDGKKIFEVSIIDDPTAPEIWRRYGSQFQIPSGVNLVAAVNFGIGTLGESTPIAYYLEQIKLTLADSTHTVETYSPKFTVWRKYKDAQKSELIDEKIDTVAYETPSTVEWNDIANTYSISRGKQFLLAVDKWEDIKDKMLVHMKAKRRVIGDKTSSGNAIYRTIATYDE